MNVPAVGLNAFRHLSRRLGCRIASRHLKLAAYARPILFPLMKTDVHQAAPQQQNVNASFWRKYSAETRQWTDTEIKEVVDSDRLVVFMKGVPWAPQCGFSKYVIEIFNMHGMEDFVTVNILEDDVLRSRIKDYSNWPTIPQVYMNGEFIGGFDILLQMHKSGDLVDELEKIGHRSKLLDEKEDDGSGDK